MDQELPAQRVFSALEDIRRVLQDTTGDVHGQHLVSQVVLKRFAPHSGPDQRRIIPFNLDHPDKKHPSKSPKACGKVTDFAKFGSGYLERQVWKPIEDALPEAFKVVDDGTLFNHPEHVATIKNAIALHYVRSTQIRDLQRGMWPDIQSAHRAWWLGQGLTLLDQGYFQEHGLYPGGSQERGRFIDDVMAPWTEAAESELLFDGRLEPLFRQACAMFANFRLEILKPVCGQFLIGDVPALTVRHDRIEVGVRNGIALGDAHSVVLPLGPHNLAALGPVNKYHTIPVEMVDRLNAIQVQAADRYVYFRPGSGLESFVCSRLHMRAFRQVEAAA